MKLYFKLLFAVFMSYSSVYAQKNELAKAYYVDLDSNRVEGYIQVLKEVDNQVKIKFKAQTDQKKFQILKTNKVIGYGYEATFLDDTNVPYFKWRHFSAFEFERPSKILFNNVSLIESVLEGYYSLKKFDYDTGSNVEMPVTTRYVVFCEGQEVAQVELDNFEEEAQKLFGDYTALANSIGTQKFRFKNFIRLANDYNYWILNEHDPTIYKLNPAIYTKEDK